MEKTYFFKQGVYPEVGCFPSSVEVCTNKLRWRQKTEFKVASDFLCVSTNNSYVSYLLPSVNFSEDENDTVKNANACLFFLSNICNTQWKEMPLTFCELI